MDFRTIASAIESAVFDGLAWFYSFGMVASPWSGLVLGVALVGMWACRGEPKGFGFLLASSLAAAALLLGPGFVYGMPWLVVFLSDGRWTLPMPEWLLYAQAGGTVAGLLAGWGWLRWASPYLNALSVRHTKRSGIERNKRTDVRRLDGALPPEEPTFDPVRYQKLDKGIFIGRGEHGPVYVPREDWRRSHVHVIGTTGSGKGVASGVMLSQALHDGEAVVVLDPKDDEWAPHVLRDAAEKAGVPFRLVDLRKNVPQIDFLAGVSDEDLEELLIAGFSLSDKGDVADYHRVHDRAAAAYAGAVHAERPRDALDTLFWEENLAWLAEQPQKPRAGEEDDPEAEQKRRMALGAAGFVSRFKELIRVRALLGPGGVDLREVMEQGGCLYVIGSLRIERVRIAQRMLFLRLLQLAEKRDRMQENRPVCLFLDEFRYHISRPSLDGLATARDKGLHVIMAHQSLGDLDDVPADLSPEAVRGAVVENAAIRIAYRVRDPETAAWLGRMSGQIQVDDEVRRFERNAAMADVVDHSRTVRQAERDFFDLNTLQALPRSWAALYGVDTPQFVHISPMKTAKRPIEISRAPERASQEAAEGEISGEGGGSPYPVGIEAIGAVAGDSGRRPKSLVIEDTDDEPDF